MKIISVFSVLGIFRFFSPIWSDEINIGPVSRIGLKAIDGTDISSKYPKNINAEASLGLRKKILEVPQREKPIIENNIIRRNEIIFNLENINYQVTLGKRILDRVTSKFSDFNAKIKKKESGVYTDSECGEFWDETRRVYAELALELNSIRRQKLVLEGINLRDSDIRQESELVGKVHKCLKELEFTFKATAAFVEVFDYYKSTMDADKCTVGIAGILNEVKEYLYLDHAKN
ncbi:hypothetical protein AYI69_g795 [Smittium culicis]|uniref:Uncharacterized protein n=1 Tax=Smittium culicis TaxID=133412 RepID=A0A1R1Y7K9_9FUNG|nr:hypothetical protein AYI69_g5233 [Smittium culicis]OMJ29692.1 hypothetical protein AYI69_g795 [Smittium culicis]